MLNMLIFVDSVNIVKHMLLELFWLKFFSHEYIEFKYMLLSCDLGKSLILWGSIGFKTLISEAVKTTLHIV